MQSNVKIQTVAIHLLFSAHLYITSYYGNIGPEAGIERGEGCFHGGYMYALRLTFTIPAKDPIL